MAKILNPDNDLRFKLSSQVGQTHKGEDERTIKCPGTHVIGRRQKKEDALARYTDAVINNNTPEHLNELRHQAELLGASENEIDKAFTEGRHVFTGLIKN